MEKLFLTIVALSLVCSCGKKTIESWPRFRGPDGTGIAGKNAMPPVEFSQKNLLWKTDLDSGFSSPVIWEGRLFITGARESEKKLTTYCINREDGKILWRSEIIPDSIERHSPISNAAQNSCATDGERVISCFGSFGLISYNMDGKELWRFKTGCAKYSYGYASSPIISDNMVIYMHDDISSRFLVALDKISGKEIWKTPFKAPFSSQSGQSTPCIYNDLVIVHKIGAVAAYSLSDGSLIWNHNILTEAASSPVMAGDKVIVSCWYNISDESERPEYPDFEEMISKYDSDKDHLISEEELPAELMLFDRAEIRDIPRSSVSFKESFRGLDGNKNNELDKAEWQDIIEYLKTNFLKPSGIIAINAGLKGEISDSSVLWRISNKMSEVPSPLFYKNRIYMLKDGGILTCINPDDGSIIYQTRAGAPGVQLASPIVANEMLYLFSFNGKVTVIQTGDSCKIVSRNDLKENIASTPAVISNSIYIRTITRLMAYADFL
jgi:outer membrane protein assembly factor BamB